MFSRSENRVAQGVFKTWFHVIFVGLPLQNARYRMYTMFTKHTMAYKTSNFITFGYRHKTE